MCREKIIDTKLKPMLVELTKKLLWTSFNSFQNRQKGYCFLKMKLLFFKKETSSKFMLAVDNNFYPLLSNSALEIAKKAANSK